jgi:hypothetical protein
MSSPTQYSVIAVNEFTSAGSITAHAIGAAGTGLVARSVHSTTTPAEILRKSQDPQDQLSAQSR